MTTDEVKLEQWQDEQIDYYNREDANDVDNSTTKKTNVSYSKDEDEST